mgnify:CR=1 FL=1
MKHRFRPLGPRARLSIAVAATTVAAASAQVATASYVAAPESTGGPSLAESCTAGESVLMGRYFLHTTWRDTRQADGRQCVRDTRAAQGPRSDADAVAWHTDWRWSRGADDTPASAAAVLGWHWGYKSGRTGLPVRLSDGAPVTATWRYALADRRGTVRVGYRMWLHDQPRPGAKDRPRDEVTVWLHRSGDAAPPGEKRATVEVAGTSWDLYRGGDGWTVHSFVPADDDAVSRAAALRSVVLTDFLAELTRRGEVAEDAYLSGVEAGTEVVSGRGRLDTESLTVRVG